MCKVGCRRVCACGAVSWVPIGVQVLRAGCFVALLGCWEPCSVAGLAAQTAPPQACTATVQLQVVTCSRITDSVRQTVQLCSICRSYFLILWHTGSHIVACQDWTSRRSTMSPTPQQTKSPVTGYALCCPGDQAITACSSPKSVCRLAQFTWAPCTVCNDYTVSDRNPRQQPVAGCGDCRAEHLLTVLNNTSATLSVQLELRDTSPTQQRATWVIGAGATALLSKPQAARD